MSAVTVKSILEFLSAQVAAKKTLSKDIWLDAALKLTVLSLDEVDKLADMEQKLAQKKVDMLERQEKRNISEIELRTEATEEHKEVTKQKALLKVAEEMIRVAKLQARLNEFS